MVGEADTNVVLPTNERLSCVALAKSRLHGSFFASGCLIIANESDFNVANFGGFGRIVLAAARRAFGCLNDDFFASFAGGAAIQGRRLARLAVRLAFCFEAARLVFVCVSAKADLGR